MALVRQIWLNWKMRKPCPTCLIGTLDPPKNKGVLQSETASSEEMNSHGGYTYSEYIVSMHLKCSNCNEVVAFTFLMTEENYPSNEEVGIQKYITPLSFYPAPKIIEIPTLCPKSVKKILDETFGLYWVDISSCANKIRIAIEVLLNELNVPQRQITQKGDVELKLHARLELFKKMNSDVADFLEAIKWIGNAGSHFSSIKKEDILEAYELLEFSLEKLYSDRETKLKLVSKEINQSKKPRQK